MQRALLAGGELFDSVRFVLETGRCVMRELGSDQLNRTDEIGWRHLWLTNVTVDSGRKVPTKTVRYAPRRMSLSRRLRRLHRMRATLGPTT